MLFTVGWLLCGFIASGLFYADIQRSYPSTAEKQRRADAGAALFTGLLGPIALLISVFMTGFAEHGWALPGTDTQKGRDR